MNKITKQFFSKLLLMDAFLIVALNGPKIAIYAVAVIIFIYSLRDVYQFFGKEEMNNWKNTMLKIDGEDKIKDILLFLVFLGIFIYLTYMYVF